MTSRYPRPGTLVGGRWETDGYRWVDGQVAVLATSRHKAIIGGTEAADLLREQYGPDVTIGRVGVWQTVTAADMENGLHGDFEPGQWSEGASGSAWVRVAYPDDAVAERTEP